MGDTREETPVASPGAESLGISQEAFDSASNALSEIVAGGVEEEAVAAEAPVAAAPEEKPAEKPAKEAKEEESQPKESVAKGWAAIKQAEQEVSRMRSQLRKELAEVKQLKESFAGKEKTQADIISELKKDPRALEKYGLPLQEFLDRVINDNATTPQTIKREKDEDVATLRKELAEVKQLLQKKDVQEAEKDYRGKCEAALNEPEFELLRSYPNAVDEMMNYAAQYYQAHGNLNGLTHKKIAAILQDTWQEHLQSLSSAKAVRKVLGLPGDDAAQEHEAPARSTQAPKTTKPKTVTQSMAASPARGTAPQKVGKRSDEDVVREAARLVPQDVWDQMG